MANKSRLSDSNAGLHNPNPNGKKKARILSNKAEANKRQHQQELDSMVVNYDDSLCRPLTDEAKSHTHDCVSAGQGKPVATFRDIAVCAADGTVKDNQYIVLQEKVGSGSFADVYKALYEGKTVAVKILKPANRIKQMTAFQREIDGLTLTGACSHTLDLVGFRKGPEFWIITNFVSGGTLHSRLWERKAPLVLGEVLDVAAQLASCMTYLHNLQPPLMHRDLSPFNLLFDKNDQLKLGDFGVSVSLDEDNEDSAKSYLSVNGHPYYRAPEVERNEPYGLPAEVYSFGSILYECMTGCLLTKEHACLSPEKRVEELMLLSRDPNALQFPYELWELLIRCWSIDPLARPTFVEILARLEEIRLGL